MFTKKHPLDVVVELFDQCRPLQDAIYCLYVLNHQLDCSPRKLCPLGSLVVAVFRAEDIDKGLTVKMWDRIECKLRTLISQGVIE